MDSNNKSKPDDNQLIFDLSSLQWLFWGNWSGFDRKSGNISSMCDMLHKIWFTLQIRNIFCTNTNQGSYKYKSGCATNRSIVSWPWLTASDRGRDSCLLDGIHLVYTQTIHEVAQILIKFCTNMFKILYKYKSGWSRKRCVVGSWRYKLISHKKKTIPEVHIQLSPQSLLFFKKINTIGIQINTFCNLDKYIL